MNREIYREMQFCPETGGTRIDSYLAACFAGAAAAGAAAEGTGGLAGNPDPEAEAEEEEEEDEFGEAPGGGRESPRAAQRFATPAQNATPSQKAAFLLSRSGIQKLIESGSVLVNGVCCKANYKVKAGDTVRVLLPEPEDPEAKPEPIPLDIIYEDSDLLIVNKKRGMVVHPAAGNDTGTLVNALLWHCRDLSDINGVRRPGIVHRIDKDTTGLLAVAKNNAAHLSLAAQLRDHSMARVYFAIVEGETRENSGTVRAPIGRQETDRKKMGVNLKNGKEAVTHFSVLERFGSAMYIRCRLETGRTHQIRVHMAYIGHPVAGDPLYGLRDKRGLAGQALHAGELSLVHPATGERMTFFAPPPPDFTDLLERLRAQKSGRLD